LEVEYHDQEWGVPSFDENHLFEMLVLEGAQAGLSWSTILKKRRGYRTAFAGFDPLKVARFREASIQRLLHDPGIVRNRLKIESAVSNARAIMALRRAGSSLTELAWSFGGKAPRTNRWRSPRDLPSRTPESQAMSRELLRRGFRFVGPTICYAFMQAIGMVNDHTTDCFRHSAIRELGVRRA